MVEHNSKLGDIKAAVSDDRLFQRAVDDAVLMLMQPLIGLSIRDATAALNH